VKHNRKQTNLKDVRRIYQAFTHARQKLVIIGSMMNMREVEPNDQFIDYIKKKNWYIDINNSS
jgi:superfamily I DNA and/or RNA helicase